MCWAASAVGVLRVADAVLDPGMGTVAASRNANCPDGGVATVGLFEHEQLPAGVGAFPADDEAHPALATGQVQQPGTVAEWSAFVQQPARAAGRHTSRRVGELLDVSPNAGCFVETS
jgi:hypothetical protein